MIGAITESKKEILSGILTDHKSLEDQITARVPHIEMKRDVETPLTEKERVEYG